MDARPVPNNKIVIGSGTGSGGVGDGVILGVGVVEAVADGVGEGVTPGVGVVDGVGVTFGVGVVDGVGVEVPGIEGVGVGESSL